MKKWVQKAIVQKVISYLPLGNKINYLFQKYVTKGVNLGDEYFYDRLEHAKEHLTNYSKYSGWVVPRVTLEIGTGWYPIVPISLFLVGAEKIYSVDITFLTSKERIKTTIDKFIECYTAGLLGGYIPFLPEKFEVLKRLHSDYEMISLEVILKQLNIIYLIEDARQLSLADESIDLVNSNNTFEHIYPDILLSILKQFKRVVKKDNGIMSHSIDMSDHFAHFDNTINIYNFLQYSPSKWKWIDNSIQPQSRLRFYDYVGMYQELGIPITEHSYRKGNVDELKSITLDKEFVVKPLEEVAISHCLLVSDMKTTKA